MNTGVLKRSFNQIVELFGGGWIALAVAALVIGIIIFLIFRSGKQLKIRIPFLPKGMNTLKIGRDDLKKLPGGGDKSDEDDVAKKPLVGTLFDGIDVLSGRVKNRYEIPLYLVISQYQSVTTLVDDIGDDVLQRLDMTDGQGNDSGSCVILNHGGLIYHNSPKLITSELIHSRPERAIDGVVLVIDVADLLISDRSERRKRIDWLFKQYWTVQNEVEFILPTYVIVSGMESLEGFAEFAWHQGQLSQLNEIFGWSSPYNVESPFYPEMIDEAFKEIGRTLEIQLVDCMDEGGGVGESILAFPNAVRSLLTPLKEFAAGVLDSSLLIHPPKFRGVYFTGVTPVGEGSQHQFLQRLFKDKVFPEHALASPVQDQVLSADSRLRRMQIASISFLAVLFLWVSVDLGRAWQQSRDIQSAALQMNDIWYEKSGYDAIESSLKVLSDLNVLYIDCCGPVPWSIFYSSNAELKNFFKLELFDKRILPSIECRSRQTMYEQLNPSVFLVDGGLRKSEYGAWLQDVGAASASYSTVRRLMGDISSRSPQSVSDEFSQLVFNLYGQNLPSVKNPKFYADAITASDYDLAAIQSLQCKAAVNSGQDSWQRVIAASNAEIKAEKERIAAPLEFIRKIIAVESASIDRAPISNALFTRYLTWHSHIEETIGKGVGGSFCATTKNALQQISGDLAKLEDGALNYKADIDAFVARCESELAAQMDADNSRMSRPLYQSVMLNGEFSPMVSRTAESVFDLIDQMSNFTFSSAPELQWTNHPGDFFWSVDLLGVALGYADEYFSYAQGKFASNYLPDDPTTDRKSYLAQAVALAQLQRGMLATIEAAKVKSLDQARLDIVTLDRREADIADRVANFKKALNPLLALISTFEQLGLDSAKRRLLMQSHMQATMLLEEIDLLYSSNRIYEPKATPKWSANQYSEALYGLLTNANSEDYLRAQARRSSIIARDYAQPVVIFLVNTEGEFKESDLLAKWRRSLIEISKRENKDPSNDIDQFEQFFLGDFTSTTFSNCHEAVKNYEVPTGNNVFAVRWRHLISVSVEQCQRLRADNIKKEYIQVASAFSKYLAPFYPYNKRAGAKPLSPKTLRAFLALYAGEGNGLAERMRVLAWKNASFAEAKRFLVELDASLEILGAIVGQSSGSQPGVAIEVAFDPELTPALGFDPSSHISSKRMYLGKTTSEFPGETVPLYWKFSEKAGFDLRWAAGSPYNLLTEAGQPANGRLRFSSKGYWSLLRFIEKYRSERVDSSSLEENSMLLEFKGAIQRSTTSNEITPVEVYLRMTLLGTDPDTQEKKALSLPRRFPTKAPTST
jgi:type VI secretion system protein ImpL|tara:strand:+ start:3703 stop:7641 length:3939 start_codon:yes stop_codon:yes gene_type:complete